MTETTNLAAPKRKRGRPAKIPAIADFIPPLTARELLAFPSTPSDFYPLFAARFHESAPIGFANRAETSATTTADGRMIVNVDWARRIVIVVTREGTGTCETWIPLENVRSMRPAVARATNVT